MPQFLINDVEIWLSNLPESALNTHYTLGADYGKVATSQPFYVLPEMEKRNDAGKPGNGHSYPTYTCNTYWSHPAISIQDEVNVEMAGRMLLRAMGGTVTDTVLFAGVNKHAANQLPIASGRQYPSADLIVREGGVNIADFLLAGAVVSSYQLSQNKADAPTFQADLVGTGKHVRNHGITSLPATPVIIQCIDGNNTVVQWTDSGGLKDWAATGRLISWNVRVDNQLKLNDRAPGDPFTVAAGTEGIAAYVRKLLRGAPQITAQLVVTLDNNVNEWIQMANNELLTDVTFKPQGPIIASTFRASLAMIIPKARIIRTVPGESDGDATVTIELQPYYDSASGGAIKGEVVNATTTNFR